MKQEIEQRIQRALDAGGLAEDPLLDAALSEDPGAAAEARALERIDQALRAWPEPVVADATLEALAARIEDRLDGELPPTSVDPIEPPAFDEAGAEPPTADAPTAPSRPPAHRPAPALSHSGEYSLSNLTALDVAARDSAPAPAPEPSGTPAGALLPQTGERFSLSMVKPTMQGITIDPLSPPSDRPPPPVIPRSRRGPWPWLVGGLAAAAAVLVAVTVGMRTQQADAPAPVEAGQEVQAPAPQGVSASGSSAAPAAAQPVPSSAPSPGAPAPATLGGPARPSAEGSGGGEDDTGGSPREPTQGALFQPSSASPPGADHIRSAAAHAAPAAADSADIGALDGLGGAVPHRPPATTSTTSPAHHHGTSGAAGNASLPEMPSRAGVLQALKAVQPAVAACGGGVEGVAQVHITVAGPTGRVRSATVIQGVTGAQGSCVARAVRGARFPRFRRDTFTIDYPFRL